MQSVLLAHLQILVWPSKVALLLLIVGMQRYRRRVLMRKTLSQRRGVCSCPYSPGHDRPFVFAYTRLLCCHPHCVLRAANPIRVELPLDYNDAGTWPMIRFTSSVFNPMVSPTTGELDLKSVFPEWVPGKHYMVTALTYLKKVFYMKDFSFPRPANPEAQALFQVNAVGGRQDYTYVKLLLLQQFAMHGTPFRSCKLVHGPFPRVWRALSKVCNNNGKFIPLAALLSGLHASYNGPTHISVITGR